MTCDHKRLTHAAVWPKTSEGLKTILTLCGKRIPNGRHVDEPTCPVCKILAERPSKKQEA